MPNEFRKVYGWYFLKLIFPIFSSFFPFISWLFEELIGSNNNEKNIKYFKIVFIFNKLEIFKVSFWYNQMRQSVLGAARKSN